jgi:hypothetical protein
MKTRIASLLTFLALFCYTSGQVPQKKDELTISDREEWRKILKWPDDCETGFRAYKQFSPPGGLTFYRLGPNEYLVDVGCSGGVSLFMYYREHSTTPARLLKFNEYDAAHNTGSAPYSKVKSLVHSFNPNGNILWIYSQTLTNNVCLMHKYQIKRGRSVLLKSRKLPCAEVAQSSKPIS